MLEPRVTFTDRFLGATFLKLIPKSVPPNYITVARFSLIPSVYYSLYSEQFILGLILFAVAAFTDALDGAMARTRNQITDWGKVYDPVADKLLVGGAAVLMIAKFLGYWIVGAIIAIEVFLVGQAAYKHYIQKKSVEAKLPGKVKMLLQCIGVIFVFLFAIFGGAGFLLAAKITLLISIFFALLSLVVYQAI